MLGEKKGIREERKREKKGRKGRRKEGRKGGEKTSSGKTIENDKF